MRNLLLLFVMSALNGVAQDSSRVDTGLLQGTWVFKSDAGMGFVIGEREFVQQDIAGDEALDSYEYAMRVDSCYSDGYYTKKPEGYFLNIWNKWDMQCLEIVELTKHTLRLLSTYDETLFECERVKKGRP